MLLRSKTDVVLSVVITALSVASMVAVFSICARGLSSFLAETRRMGVSPLQAAYSGMITLATVFAQFFLFVFSSGLGAAPLDGLFSEKGVTETQPAFLLLIALCSLIVSYFSLKILFAVRRKQRRHFYSSLLSAGASPAFARACTRAEARFLCAGAVPTGFGTFLAMISNFESNNSLYVLMRALGASGRMINRTVRREGVLCVLIGGCCSTFCTVFLFCLLYNIYGRAAGLTLQALLSAVGGIFAMTAVFSVGVAAAVRVTCRRLGMLDLIRELKEISYS